MLRNVLEDLATLTLTEHGVSHPVDAFDLAIRLGLSPIAAPVPASVLNATRREIYYPRTARPSRAHGQIAHECAHFLLMANGLPNEECWADYLGACLIAPATAVSGALARVGLDLPALAREHPNASHTLLVTRMAEVLGGTASLFERGELRWVRGPKPPAWSAFPLARAAWRLDCPITLGAVSMWHLGGGYVAALEL